MFHLVIIPTLEAGPAGLCGLFRVADTRQYAMLTLINVTSITVTSENTVAMKANLLNTIKHLL